jgi:hypothetical protein
MGRGRPKTDPSTRKLSVQLAAPADLPPRKLALWHREFDRFPPGYYVPADLRGMLLYLDACEVMDAAQADMEAAVADKHAGKAAIPVGVRIELREAMKLCHQLQKDLRMFPVTRTHREIHGSLANNPTTQAPAPGEAQPGWRQLFAVPNGSDKPTAKKRKG